KERNPFAIFLLSDVNDSTDFLKNLLLDTDLSVRANAALSLIKKKIPISEALLKEFLVKDQRDLGFQAVSSPAGSLSCWRVIPNAEHKKSLYPGLLSQSLLFRQQILQLCLELSEEDFLTAAKLVMDHKQTELVPLLIELMVNHQSPKSIEFLKDQQQRAGAPFIRQFCTLALFKLKESGFYEEQLYKWVAAQENNSLIRFKEDELSEKAGSFILSPE
ncbi:hypothetical protein I8752_21975, partial [Nostocaceae cyanobacterium CENA369]